MTVRSKERAHLTLVDLFSGAGGLALGWLSALPGRASFVAAVDSDPALADVFAWNFPATRFAQTQIDSDPNAPLDNVLRQAGLASGNVDVLLAGPPCQSLSRAGKRSPHPDNRLVLRVCDAVELLRPRVVVIENVPELAWIYEGRLLGRARLQLHTAGYATDTFVLNATDFGIPQLRMRCFTIGILRSILKAPDPDLRPPPTHRGVASARPRLLTRPQRPVDAHVPVIPLLEACPTVGEAIGDLPRLAPGESFHGALNGAVAPSAYACHLRSEGSPLYNHESVAHGAELAQALAALEPGETPQSTPGHPLRRKEYFRSAYARLHSQWVAPTMTTQTHNPGSGRFTHYSDPRVLTVREVARLQSFPDTFRFFGNDEVQRRHVGNAVPPLLSSAIARHLLNLI